MHVKLAYVRGELWFQFPEETPVNVARLLQSLKNRHPDVYERWHNKKGQLHGSLAVFVNREHIRYRKGLDTELRDGDEVYVITTVAGG
jgi:molybdopterin synthase sulfur carrier subunit